MRWGVNLSYPCPSYGQYSHWLWLSNAYSFPLFHSGLTPVSLSFWDFESHQTGVLSAVLPFEERSMKPESFSQGSSPSQCLFSLQHCLRMLYTAPQRILNSLEAGHLCRALKLFSLYAVRWRKPLLYYIVSASNHHCGFL